MGAQGVKGAVKLKVYGQDPATLVDYPPLADPKSGKTYRIDSVVPHGSIWVATIAGVADRTAAQKLFGTKLYLDRALLPKIKKKNTYYHADLIGLAAVDKEGKDFGRIIAVANFGAGDLLEIKPQKGASFYLPFTNAYVPHVDLEKKIVTIDPPEGLI
jgi:16S rRNA processing protein RimM